MEWDEWKQRGLTGKNVLGQNKEQVIADYEGGMSAYAIAKKYGVHKTTACKFVRRHILGTLGPAAKEPEVLPDPLPAIGCEPNKEELKRDWKAGMPMRHMVHKYGVSRQSIWIYIKRHFKPKSVPDVFDCSLRDW